VGSRLFFLVFLLACSTDVDLGGTTTSDAATIDAAQCGDLVAPSTKADCHACNPDASDCQPNGCYGGYWCFPDASDCRSPPVTCP
jgi:hypothetical protein